MKVLVFGAGGIIGQHMQVAQPQGYIVRYMRSSDLNLCDKDATDRFLDSFQPDVIVNLAGENRVDVVQAYPERYEDINVHVPIRLSNWCRSNGSHLIQGSTQGVFSGENPPYSPNDAQDPITEYGVQKASAEVKVDNWTTVARLTFVLGIRPFSWGRPNPVESMLTTEEQLQVNDRWFSPCFAEDAAKQLWRLSIQKPKGIYHIGTPVRTNRYEIASKIMQQFDGVGYKIIPVSHNHFTGIAPRPKDTTWASDSLYSTSFDNGIKNIIRSWSDQPRTKS